MTAKELFDLFERAIAALEEDNKRFEQKLRKLESLKYNKIFLEGED